MNGGRVNGGVNEDGSYRTELFKGRLGDENKKGDSFTLFSLLDEMVSFLIDFDSFAIGDFFSKR